MEMVHGLGEWASSWRKAEEGHGGIVGEGELKLKVRTVVSCLLSLSASSLLLCTCRCVFTPHAASGSSPSMAELAFTFPFATFLLISCPMLRPRIDKGEKCYR